MSKPTNNLRHSERSEEPLYFAFAFPPRSPRNLRVLCVPLFARGQKRRRPIQGSFASLRMTSLVGGGAA
jgi:hypothetical protein